MSRSPGAASRPETDAEAYDSIEQLPRTSVRGRVAAWWTTRRLIVMAVIWPIATLGALWLASSRQPVALVLLIAFGAALSLTTYTPAPGQRLGEVLGSPCSALGGILPTACAVSLLSSTSPGNGVFALALVGFGLSQRLGGGACAR